MYAPTTQITVLKRFVLATLAMAIAVVTVGATAEPAEAATRTYAASAICRTAVKADGGTFGYITVESGLRASGRAKEYAAVGYTIQKWDGKAWRNHVTKQKLITLNGRGSDTVTLPGLEGVFGGYYRVYIAMAWNENGQVHQWSGFITYYNGARQRYCQI